MKKLISVLLCIAMMFTFLTLISSAADVSAAADGSESILSVIGKILAGANWGEVFGILVQSFAKIFEIISHLAG